MWLNPELDTLFSWISSDSDTLRLTSPDGSIWCVHTVPQRVTRTVMRVIHKKTVEVIMETWLLNTKIVYLLCSLLAASVGWDLVSRMSDPSRMVGSQLVKLACKIPVTVLSPWVLQQPKSKTVPVACFLCFGSWNTDMSQQVPLTWGRIPPMLTSTTSPLKSLLTCSICPPMATVVPSTGAEVSQLRPATLFYTQ